MKKQVIQNHFVDNVSRVSELMGVSKFANFFHLKSRVNYRNYDKFHNKINKLL